MIRLADAIKRKKQFLLARTALSITTALVGLTNPQAAFMAVVILMLIAAISSAACVLLDPFVFFNDLAQATFMIVDTAIVFTILMVSDAGLSYFIPFFVVLGLTAQIEKIGLLVGAAFGVALVSVTFAQSDWSGSASLLPRIGFLVSTAVYYWIVVLPDRGKSSQNKQEAGA